jgi:hypothetical protein
MFSNFSSFTKIVSTFTASVSSTDAPETANKPKPSKLSAARPPFVPTVASRPEPPSFALDDDGPAESDETANAGEFECEFEPQSANIDAEIQSEMDECLNQILKAQCVGMNYSAAAKVMTDTISKHAQRSNILRHRRERSRDDVDANDSGRTGYGGDDDQSASEEDFKDENDENDDARAATKSFGATKVSNYYRTKPERDAARQQHVSDVAKRSGRHPNHRNVAMQAHRLAPDQKKSGLRGGRSSHAVQEQ